ncbi:MAG: hypothetical protein WCZ86_03885 [Desulfurivibrionaceae bacterium]|jgi:hypothetical protein
MGDSLGYTMPAELAKKIKPMPADMMRLITIKQLNTQAYWVRPVITGARPSACPCCGAVHPLAAHGVCGGCYDPTTKKGLYGHALLDHLAHRAKCGKKIRPSGPKAIKKSISPASVPSYPAAPHAGAGLVESQHLILKAIHLSLGLDPFEPLSEIPNHIDTLIANVIHHKEQGEAVAKEYSKVAEIIGVKGCNTIRERAVQLMAELDSATAKVAKLTEEVATLNRLMAREPIRESSVTIPGPRETCENILGILGIGNGIALIEHDPEEDEDLEAITAGLIRGAIAEGVWGQPPMAAQEFTDDAIVAKWSALPVPDGYEALTSVLQEAIDQAANGKGLDRHADGKPFHEQPILREAMAVGLGFPAGQARKKILEAVRCCDDHPERAVADLLGAINYTAALIIAIRSMMVERAA